MTLLTTFVAFVIAIGLVVISRCEITPAHGVDVSCHCGAKVATGVIIVDDVDIFYLERTLSEDCPGCRAAARHSSIVSERVKPQSEKDPCHVC